MRRGRIVFGLALALGGCDLGPSGPGLLTATVSGPEPLGGAVLEVVGAGIQGFEGSGGVVVVGSATSAVEPRYRVLVIDRVGGELHFTIRVDDVSRESITAAVVSATSPSNRALTASVVSVRVKR
jgi:hypothetical protein